MGGTDLAVIYWAACDQQDGMHMTAPDMIVTELIDPDSGQVIARVPLPQRRPRGGHRHHLRPAAGASPRSAASAAPARSSGMRLSGGWSEA